jgi:hypothetical protein
MLRIIGHCADYRHHDEREDAEVGWLYRCLDQIHTVSKRLAGWVEAQCARLRGRAGGQ